MRAGFDSNLVRIAPLDSAETTSVAHNDTEQKPSDPMIAGDGHIAKRKSGASSRRASTGRVDDALRIDTRRRDAETADEPAAPMGQHTLKITLAEPSWVEVTTADGQKLEYGLLAAGTTHTYHSAQSIDARLGNVTGATVEVDGKAQDLTPFRHANVAHFKLSGGDTRPFA